MKLRLLLAAAGLLTITHSHAQTSWCPPGAVWQYNYGGMSFSGSATMRYAGDTLVSGYQAQVLRRSYTVMSMPGSLPSVITRVSNDSVFFWNDNSFVLLYCFNAQPGDSWLTNYTHPYGVCAQQARLEVDTVGTQVLAGRPVRWLAVHITGNISRPWGRIYEGIGGTAGLQPEGGLCGGTDPDYIGYLNRFQATGLMPVGPGSTGAQLTVLATAESRAEQAGFIAFPSPTAGLLTIQLPKALAATGHLSLRDLTGRQVWQQAVPASQQIDLSQLPRGLYQLTVESAGQPPLSRRVELR